MWRATLIGFGVRWKNLKVELLGAAFGLRRARNLAALLQVCVLVAGLAAGSRAAAGAPSFSVQPAGNEGFDVYVDGHLVAPVRLSSNGAILADKVETVGAGLRLSGLRAKDPLAVTFGADDFVSVTIPPTGGGTIPLATEPQVRFKLSLVKFDAQRWQAMFPDAPAPFHFLACSLPTAQVWHQRGWLNATPNADPFPLLQDVHVGSPEVSCLWNRNWSYICPLGGHPIPMIGAWDPSARLYVGYDFQEARATDQSERYVATAYCWQQGSSKSFITLAYPYGGQRYGQQVYPQGGEVVASFFHLIADTDMPGTEDPNERFQARLFARYADALPNVPAMNDLSWIPGKARRGDFISAPGLNLWSAGGETTFYPAGTLLVHGWGGHREMPVEAALRRGDSAAVANARSQLETLLSTYAKTIVVDGETCMFWEKPLAGAWLADWGGAPVTTIHNTEGWFPARVLVELYRYDRAHNQAKPEYLQAIDRLFNWAKHFVWTRNEFADVPSSPFAIGGTLSAAFLLDYYFTFKNDPQRAANAQLALSLANRVTWRYLQVWAMDSDRYDGALDGAFLAEPNSGRDWAGLACSNEVNWNLDALTQVYVHTGDSRLRYYLRGMLQRWPALYRANYEDSLADYGSDALTEGLGLFDGSGPGRGVRYEYGFTEPLPINEPVGNSLLRVVAGAKACIAFAKNGTASDVANYRTDGNGACGFRLVSTLGSAFDVSFSYPFVDVSGMTVALTRAGVQRTLGSSEMTRPTRSPSSFYLKQLRHGDVLTIGNLPANLPVISLDTPRVYVEATVESKAYGDFTMLKVNGDLTLTQDWNGLHSFAGIIPGERWLYGVPYQQRTRAATNSVAVSAPGAHALLVAYAPPEDQTLTAAPALVLDDTSQLSLTGQPALAWQGWPPIFTQRVLLDYALVPAGRTVRQVQPRGTLVMAATAYTGTPEAWVPVQSALAAAGAEFARAEAQRLALLALRATLAALPAGKIAVLPMSTGGAGASFGAVTGLRSKWVQLTETQLVDAAYFNPTRFPLAFYLGGEPYVKTVVTNGDGKAAVTRYLAGGGTLVLFASGPFPFYYGYGPGGQSGPPDVLLPTLGLPLENAFEQAPPNLRVVQYRGQSILSSSPEQFAFPPGDPRLRSVNRSRLNSANRYVPLLKVLDTQGRDYGDAAGYIEFRTGSAKGGKVLYIWCSLLSGPQGSAIMADALTWILDGTLRPPRVEAIHAPAPGQAVLAFTAKPNLLYTVEYRSSLESGGWARLIELAAGLTNRSIRLTNTLFNIPLRFYRSAVRP